MDRLWAPWRMEYILSAKTSSCIFCFPPEITVDRERLLLHASEHVLVMLNRYPYSNAHLMVAPRVHTTRLDNLSPAAQLELIRTVARCQGILEAVVRPCGMNIGINLGKAAGAGVDDHLHIHLVPRWEGDGNFMCTIAGTRVIPEHLLVTYDALLPYFSE